MSKQKKGGALRAPSTRIGSFSTTMAAARKAAGDRDHFKVTLDDVDLRWPDGELVLSRHLVPGRTYIVSLSVPLQRDES